MPTVNKDEILLQWAAQNPYLTDALLMNFLSENNGSCDIVPIPGEEVAKRYIDGTAIKRYDFMFRVMFDLSQNADTVNTDNMFTLRQWQEWIEEQERGGNYPDFGGKCSAYRLENLSNMPQLAQVYNAGNKAKFQFPARLTYTEKK